MSGYEVDPAALRSHAARLGRIAGQIEHAADAANEEGIGGAHPYGLLFSPIAVPVLGAVAAAAKQLISGAGALGRGMQSSLSKNTDVYELVEQRTSEALKGLVS